MIRAIAFVALLASSVNAAIPANLQEFWGNNEANAAALERLHARIEQGTQSLALGQRGTLSPKVKQPTRLDRPPRMVFPNRKAKDAWIASVRDSLDAIRRGIKLRESLRVPLAWSIEKDGDIGKIGNAVVFQVLTEKEMLIRCDGKPQPKPVAPRPAGVPAYARGTNEYLRAISDIDRANEDEQRNDEEGNDFADMDQGPTIMFLVRGISTRGMTDEAKVTLNRLFVAKETKTYPTLGGSNTVRILEPIDLEVVERHWIEFRMAGPPTSKAGSKPEKVAKDGG